MSVYPEPSIEQMREWRERWVRDNVLPVASSTELLAAKNVLVALLTITQGGSDIRHYLEGAADILDSYILP